MVINNFISPPKQQQKDSLNNNLFSCSWPLETKATLKVYLDTNEKFSEESSKFLYESEKDGITFGSFENDQCISFSTSITLDDESENLFMHCILDSVTQPPIYFKRNLIAKRTRKEIQSSSQKLNLLSSENFDGLSKIDNQQTVVINPFIWISLVSETPLLNPNSLVPTARQHINFHINRNTSIETEKSYDPIFYSTSFWDLKENFIELEAESKEVELKINFYPVSYFKFQSIAQLEFSFQQMNESNHFSTISSSDIEDLKRMFTETHPVLVIVTFLVSLLHSLFEFLAFKNDISFWKNKKKNDLAGFSVRSLLINIAFQAVIFLYLLDSETSRVVLLGVGIGLLIEIWKIPKVVKVSWSKTSLGLSLPSFKFPSSYSNTKTKEYDEIAVKYLSFAAIPLLFGYSIYSIIYSTHKSYYSFVLNTLVGFVYTFGFILMTPQLFINYKLKSVPHLPWKAFMYKALNTFVDDLFAFVIKMPLLHRVACFRDDILFLIYLYQYWKYPVDKTRVNEFGQGGEEVEPDQDKKTN